MSRNVNLDSAAIAVLEAHKRKGESFSSVVKRLVPPPIRTCADLELYLEQTDGPILDLEILEKVRSRKRPSNSKLP